MPKIGDMRREFDRFARRSNEELVTIIGTAVLAEKNKLKCEIEAALSDLSLHELRFLWTWIQVQQTLISR